MFLSKKMGLLASKLTNQPHFPFVELPSSKISILKHATLQALPAALVDTCSALRQSATLLHHLRSLRLQ